MRFGFERLFYFVREQMKHDVLEGHMFLFLGKNKKRAKVLFFDRTGLVLLIKRMEEGKVMNLEELKKVKEINLHDLSLVLAGARIRFPSK